LGALFWLILSIIAFLLAAVAFAYYLHERQAPAEDAAGTGHDDFDELLHDLRSRKRGPKP
jgi:hypothetical protein